MIKSNSPFYITTPFVSEASGLTCQNYELSVSIWNGLKGSPPSVATYTTTKNNPTASTESDKINIARVINDYIVFAPQKASSTSLINGNNNQWVKTSVIYNSTSEDLAQITTLTVATAKFAFGSGSCLLTLNGTQYTIPITTPLRAGNALNIQTFVDALPDYSATVSNNVVTITAVQTGLQLATTWEEGTAIPMLVNVLTTQTGSTGAEAPQYETTRLMSLGYSYGNEGENVTTITDNTLIPIQDYKVYREGVFVVPILVSEDYEIVASAISYPSNEINQTFTIPATKDSNELVRYIWVDLKNTTSDSYVIVKSGNPISNETLLFYDRVIGDGGIMESTSCVDQKLGRSPVLPKEVLLNIFEEPKYTPVDIFFQNKEGAEQVLTFFKEQKSSLSVTSSEFESDRGQPSLGNHQFVRYNVQGRSDLTLNSGFVYENMNEIFTQMLLSERIWIYNGTNFTPLNIKSKELSYKTQLKERLINYEINFQHSYNEINNI